MNEVRVEWGTGIAGHVAESGEPVNIPDAYQVSERGTQSMIVRPIWVSFNPHIGRRPTSF